MSCGPVTRTFRILDENVGWDPSSRKGLTGLDDASGVVLAPSTSGAADPADILRFLPPPWLARGCGPCEWYLVTPARPAPRLLRRNPCDGAFRPVVDEPCDFRGLVHPIAVAVRGHRVAVSDPGAERVFVWAASGERMLAAIPVEKPEALTFTSWGELLVAVQGSDRPLRFGPDGAPRGTFAAPLPAGNVQRLAVGDDCAVWLVTGDESGGHRVWRVGREDDQFGEVSAADLADAFRPTGITRVSNVGFCLEECGPDGVPVVRCYSRYGRVLPPDAIPGPTGMSRALAGQLLTEPLDSGIPRCRWHRVRIEAEVPTGTTLNVTVATSEVGNPPDQGDPPSEGTWRDFPSGTPHPTDWQEVAAGTTDFLVRQPPGRFLLLRMRLTGDDLATPTVRRIRIDFPRSTSLEFLPPIYREDPQAEDFTERFLGLFDSGLEDLDTVIGRYPALLDGQGVPEEVLPWIGHFLGLAFDPSWNAERRRALLAAAPRLHRRRGTVRGLTETIELALGVKPVIQELAVERRWGAIARNARLGSVCLFGRARARFRLGASALGGAPVKSYGDPDHDPHNVLGHRFRVVVPPHAGTDPAETRRRLEQLIETQKPAHTAVSVRVGGLGLVIGPRSRVGIDTAIAPVPAPVLGRSGNVRLRRMSVLWPRRGGSRGTLSVGRTAALGIQTVVT